METGNFCLVGELEGVSAPFYIKDPEPGLVDQGNDGLMVIVVVNAFDKLYRFYLFEEDRDVRKYFFELYAKVIASRIGDRVCINAEDRVLRDFGRRITSFKNMSRYTHNKLY